MRNQGNKNVVGKLQMEKPPRKIRLVYSDIGSFVNVFPLLKEGRMFIPGKEIPAGTAVDIELILKDIDRPFTVTGRVSYSSDSGGSLNSKQVHGSWVDICDDARTILDIMETDLAEHDDYAARLNLTRPSLEDSTPEARAMLLMQLLASSEKKGIRIYAIEALSKMGEPALKPVRKILDNRGSEWYTVRNALLILSAIGKSTEDAERAERFLQNQNPRVREEAVAAIGALKGGQAEDMIVEALNDTDLGVVRRALGSLYNIRPISETSKNRMRDIIESAPPRCPEARKIHKKKIAFIKNALIVVTQPREEASFSLF